MSFDPYLRMANDGTYELLVPSAGGSVHVLPYCSRKGQEQLRKIRHRYERNNRRLKALTLYTEPALT
jgi:hypothetical protein